MLRYLTKVRNQRVSKQENVTHRTAQLYGTAASRMAPPFRFGSVIPCFAARAWMDATNRGDSFEEPALVFERAVCCHCTPNANPDGNNSSC